MLKNHEMSLYNNSANQLKIVWDLMEIAPHTTPSETAEMNCSLPLVLNLLAIPCRILSIYSNQHLHPSIQLRHSAFQKNNDLSHRPLYNWLKLPRKEDCPEKLSFKFTNVFSTNTFTFATIRFSKIH